MTSIKKGITTGFLSFLLLLLLPFLSLVSEAELQRNPTVKTAQKSVR